MLTSNDLINIDNIVKKRIIEAVEKSVDKAINKRMTLFEIKFIKKINLLIFYFEKEFIPLESRVTRIEKHLNLN